MESSLLPPFHIPSTMENMPYCTEDISVHVMMLLNSNAENHSTLICNFIPNNKTIFGTSGLTSTIISVLFWCGHFHTDAATTFQCLRNQLMEILF